MSSCYQSLLCSVNKFVITVESGQIKDGEPRAEDRKGNKETFKPQIVGQKFTCYGVMYVTAFF